MALKLPSFGPMPRLVVPLAGAGVLGLIVFLGLQVKQYKGWLLQSQEVNRQLTGAPEIVNSDPHGQGWLVVLRVADASALSGLMDAKSYEAHLAGAAK